jgi:selenocysteine-specific elongation factor
VIIATAGHVDHGKTSLVKQLTGTDTDRLEEEKRRGLSINLGFAYRKIGDTSLGFIDVPGHKRFINTMISGVSGIDMALLVVAADDGPMPQTIEHLEVLLVLGIKSFSVVISKIDKVDDARIQTVREKTLALLPEGIAKDCNIFEISNTTNKGIDELKIHLNKASLTHQARAVQGLFRQAIDRVFSLKGAGIVITGTVSSGKISLGDSVQLQPKGKIVKVRDIHANDQPAKIARAGQRCALNISGDIDKEDLHKGDWLLEPAALEARDCFSARCRLLTSSPVALKHMSPVTLHIGARHLSAKISFLENREANKRMQAGDERLVRFLLDEPVCCFNTENFLIRDDSESFTIGGGTVLDPFSSRKHKITEKYLNYLKAISASDFISSFNELLFNQQQVVDFNRFCLAWNLSIKEAENLLAASKLPAKYKILESDKTNYKLSEELFSIYTELILDAISNFHKTNVNENGIGQKLLQEILAEEIDGTIFLELLHILVNDKKILRSGGKLRLSDFSPTTFKVDQKEWLLIKNSLIERGKQIPSISELNEITQLDINKLNAVINTAIKNKSLYRINIKRFALTKTLHEFCEEANTLAINQERFTAVDFKNHAGIGRNLAIELLEYFDSIRFTQRHGNERIILSNIVPDKLFNN